MVGSPDNSTGNPGWCDTMLFKLTPPQLASGSEVYDRKAIFDSYYMRIDKDNNWQVTDLTAQLISDNDNVTITWNSGEPVVGEVLTYSNWDYTEISFGDTSSGVANSIFQYTVGEGYLEHGHDFNLYLKCNIIAINPLTNVEFYYTTVMKVNYEIVECGAAPGDLTGDDLWNVQDIVILANCVLAPNCDTNCLDEETGEGIECYGCAGLLSGDNGWNILDVVMLANCILGGDCGS